MAESVLTLPGLLILAPFLALVSITPGMCMTLALSLGASVGFKKTLSMMLGELIGVGIIVMAVVLGMASILLQYPDLFFAFKLCGGLYLLFLATQLFLSKGKMKLSLDGVINQNISFRELALQGFMTAVFNPKGWAFFVAVLPGFIDYAESISLQLTIMLSIVLPIEFASLCIYAMSGKTIRKILTKTGRAALINRFSGILLGIVGIWLIFS